MYILRILGLKKDILTLLKCRFICFSYIEEDRVQVQGPHGAIWHFSSAWERVHIARTLGWSDLPLLTIFKTEHIAADQAYFYEFNSKNRQISPRVRQSFHSHKNLFFICKNFPFTFKNTRQKENLKFKIANIVLGPQNRQNGF